MQLSYTQNTFYAWMASGIMNSNIEEYEKAVKDFSNNKENFQFTNKGKEHAAIVVSNLLRTTENEIRIYSGELNSEVANNSYLVKTLNKFLESNKKIYLILDKMPDKAEQSESLKQIMASVTNPKRSVEVKVDTNGVFSKNVAAIFSDKISHHFIVSDDSAYRFEIDADNYKAICNFNDPSTSVTLKTVFDKFFF